jgi:hypothetical protein
MIFHKQKNKKQKSELTQTHKIKDFSLPFNSPLGSSAVVEKELCGQFVGILPTM